MRSSAKINKRKSQIFDCQTGAIQVTQGIFETTKSVLFEEMHQLEMCIQFKLSFSKEKEYGESEDDLKGLFHNVNILSGEKTLYGAE